MTSVSNQQKIFPPQPPVERGVLSLINPDFLQDNEYNESDKSSKDSLTYSSSVTPSEENEFLTSVTYEEDFIPGKFEYIKSVTNREILVNAWNAITQTETWDFVKQDIESFTLSDDPRINIIVKKMGELGYDGHSGCSFGFTMRIMQFIAENGEKKFKEKY
jgi:hypothetical protein